MKAAANVAHAANCRSAGLGAPAEYILIHRDRRKRVRVISCEREVRQHKTPNGDRTVPRSPESHRINQRNHGSCRIDKYHPVRPAIDSLANSAISRPLCQDEISRANVRMRTKRRTTITGKVPARCRQQHRQAQRSLCLNGRWLMASPGNKVRGAGDARSPRDCVGRRIRQSHPILTGGVPSGELAGDA